MAQEHQEGNSVDPSTQSMRRKRGRPRKDDVSGSEPYRSRRRKVDVETHGNDPFVGQVVSGVLDGKFDAGYMLTVRIGERGSVLRGVVFEPGLSVPISPANDIAPNLKMFKRDEVSLPSAQQLPCFTPIRSRKDGVLRHRQRNASAVSSKEICADTVADLNAKVQVHSSVDIQKLPENDSNYASGNSKQDLQSTVGDHASKDGTRNVQSTNAVAECSGDLHALEIGNPSMIASDSAKTVHMEEVIGEDKSITRQSQTVSNSKQAALPDGSLGFTNDNLTNDLQDNSDIKLDTQMSQNICEAKQTVETWGSGPVSINDNNIVIICEVHNDAEPVNEVSQIKTSEPMQSAETSNVTPVFMNGASDDYCKVLHPITVQFSEQTSGSVINAKPVMEVSQTNTSKSGQSAEASHMGLVSKNGTSDNYCKTSPLVTVDTSGKLTERVADAEPVIEVSQTKTSVLKQAAESSDTGPVFSNRASDEYGKVLPTVTIQAPEQIIEGLTESIRVTKASQTKTSEPKQLSETSDSGPVFTNGTADDYVKVLPLEHITNTGDDLCEVPSCRTELFIDESALQHSVKLALEDSTVQVAERMNTSVGQESQVHFEPLASESDKPLKMSSELLTENPLPNVVIPEQLQSDQASSCGARNGVFHCNK